MMMSKHKQKKKKKKKCHNKIDEIILQIAKTCGVKHKHKKLL